MSYFKYFNHEPLENLVGFAVAFVLILMCILFFINVVITLLTCTRASVILGYFLLLMFNIKSMYFAEI